MVGRRSIEAEVNPFSPACDVKVPYLILETLDELTAQDITDKIAVLDGDLSKEPLMPKNFRFWNPEEHQKIICLLETMGPKAFIVVCQGASSIESIIEDGDFNIPSVGWKSRG